MDTVSASIPSVSSALPLKEVGLPHSAQAADAIAIIEMLLVDPYALRLVPSSPITFSLVKALEPRCPGSRRAGYNRPSVVV